MNVLAFSAAEMSRHPAPSAHPSLVGNCLTIRYGGKIENHVVLEMRHPMVPGGHPALMVGERRYVMRDSFGGRGCDYQTIGTQAIVTKASIGVQAIQDNRSIPLLRKWHNGVDYHVVHVCYDMGTIRLKQNLEPLYVGVMGGELVSEGNETLLKAKKGDKLTVFFEDGTVAVVHFGPDGAVVDRQVDPLAARLDLVDTLAGQNCDRALHELAAMLHMCIYYPHAKGPIMKALERYAYLEMPMHVRKHIAASLRILGDRTLYGWLVAGPATSDTEHDSSVYRPGGRSPLRNKTKPVNKAELEERRQRRNNDRPVGRKDAAPNKHGQKKKK